MEALRQWLLGVVACALLASIAAQLCPEGTARRAVRLAGGLLLLLALLRPPGALRTADLIRNTGGYREAAARLESALEAEREATLARGIAEGLAAYIEDKAASLGSPVRAEVTVEQRDGVPVPSNVTLCGKRSEELSDWLEAELGMAKEMQTWIENK